MIIDDKVLFFCMGLLAGLTIASAIGGWLQRRRGPRMTRVQWVPRDPEIDVLQTLLEGHESRLFEQDQRRRRVN